MVVSPEASWHGFFAARVRPCPCDQLLASEGTIAFLEVVDDLPDWHLSRQGNLGVGK